MEANQTDELCTQIRAYLEAPSGQKKPTVHLNSCRVSNSLLMKVNCLWVPEGEDSRLRLKVIKEVHDQPAVGHPGTKQTLNMICWHYYWPGICKEVVRVTATRSPLGLVKTA